MAALPDRIYHQTAVVRRQALPGLEAFCRALAQALQRSGFDQEKAAEAWCAEVAATCPRCGAYISGAELLALSRPPAAESASAKIGRLRRGDCARAGCDAFHCLLTFKPHGQLDWTCALNQAEGMLDAEENRPSGTEWPGKVVGALAHHLWCSAGARCVWIALAAALIGVLFLQWYRGGTIPLIRQPEHFRVDPALQEEAAPGAPDEGLQPDAQSRTSQRSS